MGEVNQPYDLTSRIRALEQQVDEIRKRVGLSNATISGGSLRVLHPSGTVAQLGQFTVAGETSYGMILRHIDGTLIFWSYSQADGDGFWGWYDKTGNEIFGDDGGSGQGLARPYVPGVFMSMTTPTDTNSTGSFVTLQKAVWRKQHPKMTPTVLSNVTSTTAEYRFVVASGASSGVVIAGPFVVNNGFGYSTLTPFAVPGGHMDLVEIDVQGRVASGAGLIGIRVLAAEGTQT